MPRQSARGRAPAVPATALTLVAPGRCTAVAVSDAPSATPERDPSCEAGWQPPGPPCTTSMGSIETARGCPDVEAVSAAHTAPPPLISRPLADERTRSSQHARPSPIGCTARHRAPVKHARRQIRAFLALRPLPIKKRPHWAIPTQKGRTPLRGGEIPPMERRCSHPLLWVRRPPPAKTGEPATAVRVRP